MRLILLLFACLNLIHQSSLYVSLNTPTVLLPWYSNSTGTVTYELKAKPETSCLQWKPRNDDVVAILKKTSEGTSYLGDTTRCSNSILLSPIAPKPVRRSTIIMAKNGADTYLRCDVIIDKIKKIEIVTRTRELNVGEMFENIEIAGYDDQDNVFNTLIGLSFQWTIKPSSNSAIKDINSIMKITNFDKTSYTADPKINELETKGLHGSSIMIEPINTGEVILTATFKDPAYGNTISDSVVILVRGDIFIGDLNDDNIYALANTVVDIKPRRFFRGKFVPITLPSTQYLVNISNSDIVGMEYGKIRTKKLGNSEVSVIDNYIPQGKHSSIPSVQFHVVNPNLIDVRLKDCIAGESCWYFASKSVVALNVNLFFESSQINIDEHTVLLTEIQISNRKVAQLSHKHANGSCFSIDALHKGKAELKLTLKGYINDKRVSTTFKKPLEFFKSFYVVDPITITTSASSKQSVKEIYLVELPKAYNKPITVSLKAHGGTEQFQWRLHDSPTTDVNVNKNAVITLSKESPGQIIVQPIVGIYHVLVSDAVASYAEGISTIVSIIVQPIDHFKFSSTQYEVYTNETLTTGIDIYIKHPHKGQQQQLYHRVYGYAPLPFIFKTNVMRNTLFLLNGNGGTNKKLSNGAKLILSDYGDCQLHASLTLVDRPPLKTTTVVRAYNHLAVVNNKHCHVFNALPGSDIVVSTVGGPFAKQGLESDFFTKIELVNSTVVSSNNIFAQKFPIVTGGLVKSSEDKFTLTLTCLTVGLAHIRITLGNKWTNALIETITIADVECAHPDDFVLNHLPIIPSLPIVGIYEHAASLNRHCVNTHLRYDVDFVMQLQLIHRVKNVPICTFPKINSDVRAHLSSFVLKSAATANNTSKLSVKYHNNTNNNNDNEGSSFGYYSVANDDNFLGLSNVHIKLDYFFTSYKSSYNKEVVVNFVSLPQFSLDTVHLIQHGDDVAIVPIHGGSGVFKSVVAVLDNLSDAADSKNEIVSVTIEPYSKYKHKISNSAHYSSLAIETNNDKVKVAVIKPLNKIGQVLIALKDECLSMSSTASSSLPSKKVASKVKINSKMHVSVDVLQHIHVNYTSKVMIGSSSLLEISLFDSHMRPISKDKFHLINLTYEISSEAFIAIEMASSLWPDSDYSRYWLVRPLAVGTTTLHIKAVAATTTKLQSSTVTIETYDPLRVSPNVIHAIPHMTFQLNLRGGPAVSSDHRIEYHFDNAMHHNIIDFSDQLHSIYTKNEGEVTLTLKSVSISTNQMLSQAVVKVFCHKLESVHIDSSSKVVVILQNNTVVVKAKFRNAKGHFTTFGILPQGLAIHWDVPPPNEIVSSYWLSGFDSADDGSECINLQLNDLGRFSLQLKVFIRPDYLNYVSAPTLSLHHQSKSTPHPIHYLFDKHDFETVPRLSIEPSKSLQNGWFNWKNHDQNMISSLSLMAEYSSLEYMIPVDGGATYVINSNYNNNLWMGGTGESTTVSNIDSVVHWSIISSNPSGLIQLSCEAHDSIMGGSMGGQVVIENTGQSIQCSNRNLHIKSSHVKGDAIIVANRRFQSRPVMVKVKSVNQIALILISELKAAKVVVENKRWFAFPVGYTAKFKLVAMDEHGSIFSVVQAKSYTIECVNCKNILLKNTLDLVDDGSLSVTMKYPGNVAIKISHIDQPHINFVLRFIIIHGLDPSHHHLSPKSFINRDSENSRHHSSPLSEASNNDSDGGDGDDIHSTTTVIHEITIQRPVGMIFLLSPVFTIDNHQLEWLVSDENNLKLLWKNFTHAVLYSVKLGECKLTVVSSSSRQPHGYAVVSNSMPDAIAFSHAIRSSNTSNVYISNYKNFNKCLPIRVLSNVVNSTIDHQSLLSSSNGGDGNGDGNGTIEHPFVCELLFKSDNENNPTESYIRRNFVTKLNIDLTQLMVTCCVEFVGNESNVDYHPFENSPADSNNTDGSAAFYSFSVEAHLKDNPQISTTTPLYFVPKFHLLTKSVLSSSGEISHHLVESTDTTSSSLGGGDDLNTTPVVMVPKDGTIATIQLAGDDPSYLAHISVKSSHPNCFKTQIVSDYYSNRTMLVRVAYLHCQSFKKDDLYWVEAKSNLTGQLVQVRIILSDQNTLLINKHESGSTWFYLRAAFNSLPTVISIDLTTVFFTVLSVIGTVVVIFVMSGDARFTVFANDLRKVANNAAGGMVPLALQSFYKKSDTKNSYNPSKRTTDTKYKTNHLLQSSHGSQSNPSSMTNSSKNSVKSAGFIFDRPPTNSGGAIYDDDFGKLSSHQKFKPYNVSH